MLLLVRKGRMKAYEDVRRDMKINKGIAVAVAALSIVGLAACGNSNAASGTTDTKADKEAELTTVRQRPYDMAVDAAQKALALIEGQPIEEPFETFPVQLQVRNSTAKPRTAPLL
jgi:DNA-binding LacI/PurR family transcriptional regulator